MNIRNSAESQARLIPNHQRIISSKQWIIDDKNSKDHGMGRIDDKRRTSTAATMPSAAAVGLESKKKTREVEASRLQMEYNSVKQENDKLKNVISKLKQEIDIYTNLLNHGGSSTNKTKSRPIRPQENAMMKSLLINTTKRRKKSDTPSIQDESRKVPGQHTALKERPLAAAKTTVPTAPTATVSSRTVDEKVSPDDILLMNTLTDVLNHME